MPTLMTKKHSPRKGAKRSSEESETIDSSSKKHSPRKDAKLTPRASQSIETSLTTQPAGSVIEPIARRTRHSPTKDAEPTTQPPGSVIQPIACQTPNSPTKDAEPTPETGESIAHQGSPTTHPTSPVGSPKQTNPTTQPGVIVAAKDTLIPYSEQETGFELDEAKKSPQTSPSTTRIYLKNLKEYGFGSGYASKPPDESDSSADPPLPKKADLGSSTDSEVDDKKPAARPRKKKKSQD